MQAKKKQEQQIEQNIEGFVCSKLEELPFKIEVRQLLVLKIIIQISNFYRNSDKFTMGGKLYKWISYSVILKRLKGTHYTTKMLKKDLKDLDALGLIDRFIEQGDGRKRVFFHIADTTKDLYIFPVKGQ